MTRKGALIQLFVGITLLILGFFLTFFWMEGLQQGWHLVRQVARLNYPSIFKKVTELKVISRLAVETDG